MTKIGSYYYPHRRIAPVIESVRLIGDKLRGNSASLEVIASTLGYKSTKNGAFQHTLNELRRYGLIDGRGKEVKLSELAHKILAPHKGEEAEAMKEMILHIPLWKEIYEKFGKTPSDFGIAIQKITGVNRLEVDAVKEEISKLYIDAVSKISSEQSITNGDNMPYERFDTTQPPIVRSGLSTDFIPDTIIELKTGETNITLPKTVNNLTVIKGIVENLIKEEQEKQKSKDKPKV